MKLITSILFFLLLSGAASAEYQGHDTIQTAVSKTGIKNIYGRLYAYIVLLYNENPHFVNLIQRGTVPSYVIGNEGFHIKEYRRYLNTIRSKDIFPLAEKLLTMYLFPEKFSEEELQVMERALEERNILLKFSRKVEFQTRSMSLDYCIFAQREKISIRHPFLQHQGMVYNVKPLIYYDEFSTSNSTFYYDMIYINAEEVLNDALIAKKIMENEDVSNYFFVGAPINDNIRYHLKQAFTKTKNYSEKIWEMFVVHELTHKKINNMYNHVDQVTGEEMALSSTIYANPHLGLSILFSYLSYNAINPHKIAALNYLSFVAQEKQNKAYSTEPSTLRDLTEEELKDITQRHFESTKQRLDR